MAERALARLQRWIPGLAGSGLAALLLTGWLAPARLIAQTVRGAVVDAESRQRLADTVVRLLAPDSQTVATSVSDESGRFELAAPRPGPYRVRVERIGYTTAVLGPLQLDADRVTEVTLRLAANAVPLDALTVTAVATGEVAALARVGYYERKRLGLGRFIERDEIERRRPQRTSDLFLSMSGVRLVRRGSLMDVLMRSGAASSMMTKVSDENCTPPIFLDGQLVSWSDGMAAPTGSQRFNLDSLPWRDIEAIEVYAGPAQVPAQYSGAQSACGVVLFWTRYE